MFPTSKEVQWNGM